MSDLVYIVFLSRDDSDASRLGYFGASWGGASAPVMVSMEERFRTAVLFEGGLYLAAAVAPNLRMETALVEGHLILRLLVPYRGRALACAA